MDRLRSSILIIRLKVSSLSSLLKGTFGNENVTLDKRKECVYIRVDGDRAFANPMGPNTNIQGHFAVLWKVLRKNARQ